MSEHKVEVNVSLDFHGDELKHYENDKDYISKNLLKNLIYIANSCEDKNNLHLCYKPPGLFKTKKDILGVMGSIGFSSFSGYNYGMEPELFKELEKEFKAGIKKQKELEELS